MAPVEIHVLVFEDSPTDVVFLREALARDPLNTFTLRVVERLSDGLPLLEAAGSDVVLLDLGLPDSQGLATFERVHQAAPDRPIVVFSGNSDEQDAIAAVRAGAQDYLVKSQSGFDMAGRAIRHAIERHNLVKSLQASELRLSTIFRTSPLPIVISRLDDGRYTEANAAFEKLTGYTAAEIIGHTAAELNIWEVPERRRKMIEAVRANGFAHNFEFQLRHRSGEHRDLLMSAELIDLDGEPQVLTVGQDITERKRMEEALQDANAKLTRAQHLAHIGSWTDYLPTLQLEWSEEMYRILGFPLNQPLNLTEATCVFPPDEKARFHQAMDAAINGTAPYNMDYRIIRSDGEVRYIHDEGEVVRDAQGQAIWMHGTTQDITERKRAEHELKQWADTFRYVAFGFVIGYPDSSVLGLMNPAFARMHGYTTEELSGTPILDVFAPESRAELPEHIRLVHETGHHAWEANHIRKDGTVFPVLVDGVAVKDDDGKVLYRIVSVQDITERKQRERELAAVAEVSAALRSAPTSADMLAAVVDRVMALLAGSAASITFDRPADDVEEVVVARGEWASVTGLRVPRTNSVTGQVVLTGQPYVNHDVRTDQRLPVHPKLVATYAVACVPLIEQVGTIGTLSIGRTKPIGPGELRILQAIADIAANALHRASIVENLEQLVIERTQKLAAANTSLATANDKLTELDRLKSKFVSDVSHELRTPVTSLSLYIDLLDHGKPEKRDYYIKQLKDQMQRLHKLINDILDLSRLERDQDEGSRLPIDLNAIVEHVTAMERGSAEAAGLTLICDAAEKLPLVIVRPDQLTRAMTNLVSNAIKYTRQGTVRVTTLVVEGYVGVEVRDTGLGIPADELPHLFGRFYRGRAVAQSTIPGTGLGLSIVKEIIESHGGTVEVESTVGVGSTFRVWLPMAT